MYCCCCFITNNKIILFHAFENFWQNYLHAKSFGSFLSLIIGIFLYWCPSLCAVLTSFSSSFFSAFYLEIRGVTLTRVMLYFRAQVVGWPPVRSYRKNVLAQKNASEEGFRAQVVGWPPLRSYRKNVLTQKNASEEGDKASTGGSSAAFVKVCMDGAPYLRKVDLKMYKSYQELSDALAKMFSSFTMGEYIFFGYISHDKLREKN